jgi:hypothetical protein
VLRAQPERQARSRALLLARLLGEVPGEGAPAGDPSPPERLAPPQRDEPIAPIAPRAAPGNQARRVARRGSMSPEPSPELLARGERLAQDLEASQRRVGELEIALEESETECADRLAATRLRARCWKALARVLRQRVGSRGSMNGRLRSRLPLLPPGTPPESGEPAVAEPAEPAVAEPAEPAVAELAELAEPAVAERAEPAVAEPAEPAVAEPAEPAIDDETRSGWPGVAEALGETAVLAAPAPSRDALRSRRHRAVRAPDADRSRPRRRDKVEDPALAFRRKSHAKLQPPPLTREQNRSRRKRDVRATTISVKRMTKRELEIGRMLYPEQTAHLRPRTRVECSEGERPCPFVSCQHHLFLDVSSRTGAIKLNFPDLEVWDMNETCALDVADRGGTTLEDVGVMMNLTRERIRQVETKAERRVLATGKLDDYRVEGTRPVRHLPVLVEPDEDNAEQLVDEGHAEDEACMLDLAAEVSATAREVIVVGPPPSPYLVGRWPTGRAQWSADAGHARPFPATVAAAAYLDEHWPGLRADPAVQFVDAADLAQPLAAPAPAPGLALAPQRAPAPAAAAPSRPSGAAAPAPWKPGSSTKPRDARAFALRVLPLADVHVPADAFDCDRLHAKLTAGGCIHRQRDAQAPAQPRSSAGAAQRARTAATEPCRACPIGSQVATQVARHAAQTATPAEPERNAA